MQSEGSLERSVPNDHDDVVDVSLPEDIVNLVGGEAGHVVSVDLQNLVSEPGHVMMLCYEMLSYEICIVNIICSQSRFPLPQPSQGSWRILGHEADEDTFVDSLHLQSNLVIFILAEHDLERSVLGELLINVIIQNSSRLNFLTNGRPTSPHTQIYETKLKYFPSVVHKIFSELPV